MMPNVPLRIGEIEGGQTMVVKRVPYSQIAIDRNRIVDMQVPDSAANVIEIFLEREFGSMRANHNKPLVLVFLCPGAHIGQGAPPFDGGVVPELDKDDLAAQTSQRQRR